MFQYEYSIGLTKYVITVRKILSARYSDAADIAGYFSILIFDFFSVFLIVRLKFQKCETFRCDLIIKKIIYKLKVIESKINRLNTLRRSRVRQNNNKSSQYTGGGGPTRFPVFSRFDIFYVGRETR